MNIGCGIDIIEIDRIKESIEKAGTRFLNRVFTDTEIAYCESKKVQKYQSYAARFAAKEATLKAVSKLLNNKYELEWKDIEILNDDNGKPQVNIDYNFDNRIKDIDISMSHCETYAVANVTVLYGENKMYKLFDSHSHLNDEKFNEDREFVIQENIKNNVTNLITAGYSVESSKKALEIAKKYEFMYTTCGISPNDIPQTKEELWKELEEVRKIVKENTDKIVAIGEIGLDYYWNTENKDLQKIAFIEQIKIANEFNLPIVIHTREAVMDTIQILKENVVEQKGVFHCCPQNRELIKEGLKLGFYISFAGPITFKNSKNANEMIELVPDDRLLIETDSPYLSPEPVRGKRNIPANVRYVAQKIADVKNVPIENVAKMTFENTCRIFKIEV